MKKLILSLCVLGLMLAPLSAATSPEKTFDVKPGKRLVIDLKPGGEIFVTGWKKSRVAVAVTVDGKERADMPFSIRKTDDGVEIEIELDSQFSKWFRKNRDFKVNVRVPEKFDLKLRSMGGSIAVHDVKGEITGRTMGGNLELKNLGGVVYMKTMGGDVTLRDSNVDGEVRTMGGRVLLEDVVGDVKGSSMGGNVIYRNVKRKTGGDSTDKVVRISTMGGAVNVDDAPRGADLHTMGGQINVKSAGDFVKAKTMGGDIHLNAVDGWIEAKTLGGDIVARMVGTPSKKDRHVRMSSLGGDLDLAVPAGLSMDVDIEITVYRNGHNEFRIKNDFGLKVEEEKEWRQKGSREFRIIRATGRIGDGKHKVELHTISGNVTLRKAGK